MTNEKKENIIEETKQKNDLNKKENKKENNTFLIILLCIMIAIFLAILGVFLLKDKKEEIEPQTEFYTENELNSYTFLGNNEDIYYVVDNDFQIFSCVFDKYDNITFHIGDYFTCGSYIDENQLLHIVEIDELNIVHASDNNSYLTTSLKDFNFANDNSWMYINNNKINRDYLWNDFIDNCNNKKPSVMKIADNTLDGLIITILFFDGSNYYAIEDISNLWVNLTTENTHTYVTKKYLECLNLENGILWYLTDEQGIGPKLLENGTLANIINGTLNNEETIDMYWVWSSVTYIENEEFGMWETEYENLFPTISIEYKEKDIEGTPFVLGEGDSAIVGTTGGKVGEIKQETLSLASAYIVKNETFEKDVKLEGKHPLLGDLSNYVVVCDINETISIHIDKKLEGTYTIRLWNGSDMGDLTATPILETTMEEETYSFDSQIGITFGEITYSNGVDTCTWNFTINAK